MLTKFLPLAIVAFSLPVLADQKNPLAAFDEMVAKSAETRDNFKLAMSLLDLRKQGLDKKCDETSLEPADGIRKILESSSAYKLSLESPSGTAVTDRKLKVHVMPLFKKSERLTFFAFVSKLGKEGKWSTRISVESADVKKSETRIDFAGENIFANAKLTAIESVGSLGDLGYAGLVVPFDAEFDPQALLPCKMIAAFPAAELPEFPVAAGAPPSGASRAPASFDP